LSFNSIMLGSNNQERAVQYCVKSVNCEKNK
jgi:hypothetical protein